MTGIDTGGSATKSSFTFDALERFRIWTFGPSPAVGANSHARPEGAGAAA